MITIRNLSNAQFRALLDKNGACDAGMDFVNDKDLRTAWRDLATFQWLKWLLLTLDGEHGFPTWEQWKKETEQYRLEYVRSVESAYRLYNDTYDRAWEAHEKWCHANGVEVYESNDSRERRNAVGYAAFNERNRTIERAREKRIAALKAYVEFVDDPPRFEDEAGPTAG
jgi:hypothetical protein